MAHLEPEALLDAAHGEGGHPHLEACARCREAVASVRSTLQALGAVRQSAAPPTGLARWALAYAGRSVRQRPRVRLLELLAASAGPLNAVRAGCAGAAALYGDDAYQLDLRLEPGPRGAHLHGQVVSLDEPVPNGWEITVVGPDGSTAEVSSDALGEFLVEGPAARWGASLIAEGPGARLVVPRFDGWEGHQDGG
jgi:hypothetical protein